MSTTPDDGGPVHPTTAENNASYFGTPGMSLRDKFAASVMPGITAAIMQTEVHGWKPTDFADEAYKLADAMLVARQKPQPAAAPAQAYAPLTIHELRDLTAMVDGAPWSEHALPSLAKVIAVYAALRDNGERPLAPVKAGREKVKAMPLPDWMPRDLWHEIIEYRDGLNRKAGRSLLPDQAYEGLLHNFSRHHQNGHSPAHLFERMKVNGWRQPYPFEETKP